VLIVFSAIEKGSVFRMTYEAFPTNEIRFFSLYLSPVSFVVCIVGIVLGVCLAAATYVEEGLHAVSTPDVLSGGPPPPGPGLCGPVLWLIFLSIWSHDLGRHIREKFLGLPLCRYDSRVSSPWLSQRF